MQKIVGKIRLLIVVAIIFAFVWFLVVSPMITFRSNEKTLEDAARRYFELNSNLLPTGERVKKVDLKTLYQKSFLKKDLYAPYSKKTCSVNNSWVKVRQENGEYKYYTYLECGVLSSTIDHNGPEIKLNGNPEIIINKGDEFTDPGIKSVVDNSDGKMEISSVSITSDVDTSKVGEYEVKYTALDKMINKTEVVRKVKVVQLLNGTIKQSISNGTNFVGEPENNYLRLSNMTFRVFGLDENNDVIIVADEDIANVNYTKIDDWLDYFYEHLNDNTKKMIVEKKYCNMQISDTTLDTTQCNSYTKKKKVYIPSIVEVNKAKGEGNFMKPSTLSWIANSKNDKEAYVTRRYFVNKEASDKGFLAYDNTYNYGVRPMMTVKGDTLIVSGDGTLRSPYTVGDVEKAKNGSNLNERFTGEYINDGTTAWRIIDVMNDGTTKAISVSNIVGLTDEDEVRYYITFDANDKIIYNPKDKNSLGYYINNKVIKYVNTSNLANHEIKVPIYKNKIIFGEETETKEYKTILSAPNMYEMFSASGGDMTSYWLINTSKAKNVGAAIYDAGSPVNEKIEAYQPYGIRVVGYFKKNKVIVSGDGTIDSPYVVK